MPPERVNHAHYNDDYYNTPQAQFKLGGWRVVKTEDQPTWRKQRDQNAGKTVAVQQLCGIAINMFA